MEETADVKYNNIDLAYSKSGCWRGFVGDTKDKKLSTEAYNAINHEGANQSNKKIARKRESRRKKTNASTRISD